MSDQNSPPLPSPNATSRRRASLSGQTIADFFGRSTSGNVVQSTTSAYPGPITTAAAQAQRRRLSLTTLGLSASPNQASPFVRSRGDSIASVSSASVDESPFEDDNAPGPASPASPFARRLSFGARALHDMRTSNGQGNGNANGRPSVTKAAYPSPPTARGRGLSSESLQPPPSPPLSSSMPTPSSFLHTPPPSLPSSQHSAFHPHIWEQASAFHHDHPSPPSHPSPAAPGPVLDAIWLTPFHPHTGEGFDFAEAMRRRAERSSISSHSHPHPPVIHERAKSVAVMEPPAREMPKNPKVPDAFQERILKGDFYMD